MRNGKAVLSSVDPGIMLMMATAFMGYVLPWGQMSFWAATVITNLFTAIPLVGESITSWLWGGYAVGNPTLTRFYSLHYLMPFLIFGLVILHIWALHIPGNNNPIGIDIKQPSKDTVPFHPYIVIKDFYALLIFLIIFITSTTCALLLLLPIFISCVSLKSYFKAASKTL